MTKRGRVGNKAMSKPQQRIQEAINQLQTCVDAYTNNLSPGKALHAQRAGQAVPDDYFVRNSRVALIGSHTLEPLVSHLEVNGLEHRIRLNVYVGPYNQYAQEILDKSSQLWVFDPDVIFLSVTPDAVGIESWRLFQDKQETLKEWQKYKETFFEIVDELGRHMESLSVVANFEIPSYSPEGILSTRRRNDFHCWLRNFNEELVDRYRKAGNVFVMDIDGLTASWGKMHTRDPKMWYYGRIAYAEKILPLLGKSLFRYIYAFKGLTKKCIVLDLDNTLWKGIIGEDGPDGIKIDPVNYPGVEYYEFQKRLLELYHRGILLAVCSKNNKADALEVINHHPHMLLREEHFSTMQINWQPKEENIKEIAKELNIGLDSLVFIDDNPVEAERVRQILPQVAVVNLSTNTALYAQTIEDMIYFETLQLTEADRVRGALYKANKERKAAYQQAKTLEQFLNSLELEVTIHLAKVDELDRISQLFQRTNQFNLTSRRYSKSEVQNFCRLPLFRLYTLSVRDRYSTHGLTGVALIVCSNSEKIWRIDNFLLSCRVLGLTVEKAFLAKIAADAVACGISILCGEFIPTNRNKPALTFYPDHGFVEIGQNDNMTVWQLDLADQIPASDSYIKIMED